MGRWGYFFHYFLKVNQDIRGVETYIVRYYNYQYNLYTSNVCDRIGRCLNPG